ncbi:hypothetical protein MRB53_017048 [Persea americana]|uniref:Uncharacterized protein n=1 Tax=Persea americana TaxID=3435 RepID=A0ACC2M427_PERAE|nr:hypothetical protein MRB53_017048 [Persea americana]
MCRLDTWCWHKGKWLRIYHSRIHAKLGGGDGDTKGAEKKFITREEEPEQYWQTAGERAAFANGWIKVPVR